jgi:cell division septal protein FtsQ
MWFKRKARNRRLGRDHVLDVKLRSSQVRAVRSRRLALALGGLSAVVFGAYLAYRIGGWTLDELVYANQAFALKELDVQTDGVISTDQLRRWAGVRLEENLLALDLARVKRDLELVPAVQFASVERILPHTLRIRVVEREPLAQINVMRPRPGASAEMVTYQVDVAGWVMLPLDPHQRSPAVNAQSADQLPCLDGLDATQVQPGRRIEARPVQAALQLITAFEQSSMAGQVALKRVVICGPETLLAETDQHSEVTFGLTDLDQQLRRWYAIADMGHRLNKDIASLDLAVTNNVPVRWLEAAALPSDTPKLPKPTRTTRKKHV